MKKAIFLNSFLFLFATILFTPTLFAQKTYTETRELGTDMWTRFGGAAKGIVESIYLDGTETYHYYYDDHDNKVKHGSANYKIHTLGRAWNKLTGTISLNYTNGKKNGKYSQSIVFPISNGAKMTYQLNGEYRNGLMDGKWTINRKGKGVKLEHWLPNETNNLSFTIKDRNLVSFEYKDWDNCKTKVTFTNGKMSGVFFGRTVKNNVIIPESPKAKDLSEKVARGDASIAELVKNGYGLKENNQWRNLDWYINEALEEGILEGKAMALDPDIKWDGHLYEVYQLGYYDWASFADCKSSLDEAMNSGLDKFDELADYMIENYMDRNRHYLKSDVVKSVQEYKNSAKESWVNNVKNKINGMNDLVSLVSYYEIEGNNIKSLPKEKQTLLNNTYETRGNQVVSYMKTNIENEVDYAALINYYNTVVKPSQKYMKKSDVTSLDSSFSKKKSELGTTVTAKIIDEIAKKESTKDLTVYYNSIQDIVPLLPNSLSTITPAYESKYAELEKIEQRAERKAARRSKVIKTLEWVGVGVAVVGGYLIYKYVLPEKQ